MPQYSAQTNSKKGISFRLHLLLGLSVPLVALLFLGMLSLWGMKEISKDVETIYADRVIPLTKLKTIADDYAVLIIDAVNKADAGLSTASKARQDIATAQSRIDKLWKAYLAMPLTAEEKALVEDANILFAAANRDIAQAQILLSQVPEQARGLLDQINGPLYKTIDPISEKITELVQLQLDIARQEYANAQTHYNWILNAMMGLLVFTLTGSVVSGFYIVMRVSRQVGGEPEQVRYTTEKVAEGDLTVRIPERTHSASILKAVGSMTAALGSVVHNVKDASQDVSVLAEQLHQRTDSTRGLLHTQQSEIAQIVSAMSEMNSTVQNVARNSAQTVRINKDVRTEMTQGREIVDKSIQSIHQLAHDINLSVKVITRLAKDSEEVGTILAVIGEIAEQTNLLALNAAIEAARAGEQGRGFAVVADEVRTLASRTHDSTHQIQGMIQKIQASVSESVSAMKSNESEARQAVSLAEQTQQSLKEIDNAVSLVDEMSTQIASAAEQQSAVADEIQHNLTVISDITQSTNDAFEEVWQAANNLEGVSKQLGQQVNYFRI
ncbi:methyl-accepting chemotaxis protein [Oceanospirillum sediminis]|uniref:Methyl-accepting chemotaxis protein n=1 Tax=Oceanospirillum sediminis TaxID=2760088 RepID=A0A839IID1_9GAMM|nr:methyl-accepting chemotaxis protein [Oceanospirillum sediminis]MBB1485083.1 methyl-accepting chemotaxis protein [Oceanospirillum sediminis]